MFIIKTQSSSKGATKYYTHRLVESKRDSMGKVYKQTILNLGSNYAVVEESDWSILTDRIQSILIGQVRWPNLSRLKIRNLEIQFAS